MKPVAIIMAGGEGLRLRPFTENTPKPMLKVGNKPILQIIVEMLKSFGYYDIIINIRYLGNIITDFFQDGKQFGVNINYIKEPKTMGTAGSIGLIPEVLKPKSPFLVVNGDILTLLNFKSFRDFHIAAGYDFTLCGRPYQHQIPFGYPVTKGELVIDFQEKPVFDFFVNSGIYCISPELIEKVSGNEYLDMPDLIRAAIDDNKRVGIFPLREEFHEIGRPESYSAAEQFYTKYLSNYLNK
jgi:NDP-sugar pyrophosphorylase family protein